MSDEMEKNKSCGFHCIKVKDIGVVIGKDEILRNINIHIHCGELTVLIGENGAREKHLIKGNIRRIKTYWRNRIPGYKREKL